MEQRRQAQVADAKRTPFYLDVGQNIQVTHDGDPRFDRSESSLAVNPLYNKNMVGASKRFTDPLNYAFSLAAYATFDGGLYWIEAPPLILQQDWSGTSDPVVAWDNTGNAYLVALPFSSSGGQDTLIGIAVYKSADGGHTWSPPNLIHTSAGDDKQGAAGDNNPASPFYGNVYAAWDDGEGIGASKLRFARTTDNGASWKGIAGQPAGSEVDPAIDDSGSPELVVAGDGTLYIVWTAGNDIKMVKSTDGGDSFSAPAVVASGITPLTSPPLPQPGGFPELPGGSFRVGTYATVCTGAANDVVVAWADYREGVSRIYYRYSTDGGNSWQGPPTGQPLLTGAASSAEDQHDFHPQLASTPDGLIGCAFYEFGPMPTVDLINVVLAVSGDNGATFPDRATVTDRPWDPAVDAPLSHGDPNTTFIGDYFGLAASQLGFFPFWTDTRTGMQEIFTARVSVSSPTGTPTIEVVGTSGVAPHRHTALSVEGSNFLPNGRVYVEVRDGSIEGRSVARGWAQTKSDGTFSWSASSDRFRQLRCGVDLAVRARDDSSGAYSDIALINIPC